MRLVLSVSIAELRRASGIGAPTVHVLAAGSYISTSLDGVGNCPPNTYNLLQKFSPRVLLVARGILAIVVMESAVGSYLYELVVSVSVPGYSAPPPVKMKLPIVAVGI